MNLRIKLTLFALAAALVFCVTVPLVSVATTRSDEPPVSLPEASFPNTEQTTSPPDTSQPEASPSVSSEIDNSSPDTELVVYVKKDGKNEAMTLEEYIVCVVAAEMPYTFHTEALKAQAVAARSYCLYKMLSGSSHESGADVCTDYAHCAAYVSSDELISRYGKTTAESILTKVKNAVKATEGQIITYQGKPALAVFHSRSYKYTESSKNLWGGNLPYLTSVPTPESDSISTVTLTDAQITELFSSSSAIKLSSPSSTSDLFSYMTDSGRHDYLCLGDTAVRAKLLRSEYGFRSLSFEYERTDGGWIFTIHGYGHGIGMSQYGANEMAKNGSTYDEILTHYYQGVKIENIS